MMNRPVSCVLGVCIGLAAFTSRASTEEKLTREFAAVSGGNLVVNVGFGAIEIVTNSGGVVKAEISRKITRRKKADEEAYLARNPVVFTTNGASIAIEARHEEKEGWRNLGSNRNEALYRVSIPPEFTVQLITAGGHIEVTGVIGSTKTRTSGGHMKFHAIKGPIEAQTSGGHISALECQGVLNISTSGGHIEVQKGVGELNAKTSGGRISVHDFEGPANLKTSGGSIELTNIKGRLDAATSGGSIKAAVRELSESISLQTSGGSVDFIVPATAAFELDAETSAGRVRTDLPITVQGRLEASKLHGTVNGGGPAVRLRTHGGNIQVSGAH